MGEAQKKIDQEEMERQKITDFTIRPLGDTLRKDANHFHAPKAINLDNENRFNYRNRGEKRDIINTDGAMFSTFRPFV
jgi:hypothetical protein